MEHLLYRPTVGGSVMPACRQAGVWNGILLQILIYIQDIITIILLNLF